MPSALKNSEAISRASIEFPATTHASDDGRLIQTAQTRLGLVGKENENRLWIELLLLHLDTPIPAAIFLPPDHELYGRPLRLVVREEDARASLDTMLLQPIDMRWDATGHERERIGNTNGIRGTVAHVEIQNGNELWVVLCFWMKEFPQEAEFLLENLPYLGGSIDMGAVEVELSDVHPDAAVFLGPRFYGGSILFREVAADKASRIGAIAETKETLPMEFEKVFEYIQATNKDMADSLRGEMASKDGRIRDLEAALAELRAAAAKSRTTEEIRAEVEAELRAAFASDKETAARDLEDKVAALTEQVEAHKQSVDALRTDLEAARAEIARRDEESTRATLLAERIEALEAVMPFSDGERTEALEAEIVAASADRFDAMLARRERDAIKAAAASATPTASAHASLKGAPKPSESLEDLIEALAAAI